MLSELKNNIESPCIRQCCLNNDDVCIGCKRSIEEILEWSAATESRKIDILKNCQLREKLAKK